MMTNPEQHPTSNRPTTVYGFCVLGELRIERDGESHPTPAYRTHSLLAWLLLHPHAQRRERLVGRLFPDQPEAAGRRRLSDHLWLLRQALPDLPLQASTHEIHLPAEARWLDVEAFRRAAADDGSRAVETWLEALSLYRGDLLAGVYDEWLLQEREALYLQYVRLAHRAADALIRQRRFRAALPRVERLVQQEPYDEKALRLLMQAYRGVGRRGAALAAYDQFVSLAADELEAEPEPATQALAEAIRAGPPVRAAPASVVPEEASAENLLAWGREALARSDLAAVEAYLARLRTRPSSHCDAEVRLLEVDAALFGEDYERAADLLAVCNSERAAVGVRAAELALARRNAAKARELSSAALVRAHEDANSQTELDALLVLARAQRKLGRAVPAARSAERALTLARSAGSPLGIARALVVTAYGLIRQGRHSQARSLLHEARALASEHGLRLLLAKVLRGLASIHSYEGANTKALALCQEELSLDRDLGLRHREAATLHNLSIYQVALGRTADGLRTLEEARRLCQVLDEPVNLAINEYHLADTLLWHDDALAPRACQVIEGALSTFQAHEQSGWAAAAWAVLGRARLLAGWPNLALDALDRAHEQYEQVGELAFLPQLLAHQGLAHLALDRPDDALQLTRQALLAAAQGEIENLVGAEIYYAHAMSLVAQGEESRGRAYLGRAYRVLLAGGGELEDDAARQAYFHATPFSRRLMEELYSREMVPRPAAGVVTRELPSARDGQPVLVRWTVDAGPPDTAIHQSEGSVALRRARLARLLREARTQGAEPTVAHLAEALDVSKRTIQRDRAALRDT